MPPRVRVFGDFDIAKADLAGLVNRQSDKGQVCEVCEGLCYASLKVPNGLDIWAVSPTSFEELLERAEKLGWDYQAYP